MPDVQIMTISEFWNKARRVNYATNGFPTLIPTKTIPAAGLASLGTATSQDAIVAKGQGAATQNILQVIPYGTGADNNTMSFRVYGWSHIGSVDNDPNKNIYIPTLITEISAILSSTLLGQAGTPLLNTEFLADTISLTIGNTDKVKLTSPGTTTANLACACAEVDFTGFPVLEIVFTTGGSATDCNALYRMF